MSDEPKKRRRWSRAWLWAAWALIAVFVLYPLSFGPVHYLYERLGPADLDSPMTRALMAFYWPLEKTARFFGVFDWLLRYADMFPQR